MIFIKIKKGVKIMGNSTGSMFYMFLLVIAIYFMGIGFYQMYLWIKKQIKNRRLCLSKARLF